MTRLLVRRACGQDAFAPGVYQYLLKNSTDGEDNPVHPLQVDWSAPGEEEEAKQDPSIHPLMAAASSGVWSSASHTKVWVICRVRLGRRESAGAGDVPWDGGSVRAPGGVARVRVGAGGEAERPAARLPQVRRLRHRQAGGASATAARSCAALPDA